MATLTPSPAAMAPRTGASAVSPAAMPPPSNPGMPQPRPRPGLAPMSTSGPALEKRALFLNERGRRGSVAQLEFSVPYNGDAATLRQLIALQRRNGNVIREIYLNAPQAHHRFGPRWKRDDPRRVRRSGQHHSRSGHPRRRHNEFHVRWRGLVRRGDPQSTNRIHSRHARATRH